eukprot:gene4905-5049_t
MVEKYRKIGVKSFQGLYFAETVRSLPRTVAEPVSFMYVGGPALPRLRPGSAFPDLPCVSLKRDPCPLSKDKFANHVTLVCISAYQLSEVDYYCKATPTPYCFNYTRQTLATVPVSTDSFSPTVSLPMCRLGDDLSGYTAGPFNLGDKNRSACGKGTHPTWQPLACKFDIHPDPVTAHWALLPTVNPGTLTDYYAIIAHRLHAARSLCLRCVETCEWLGLTVRMVRDVLGNKWRNPQFRCAGSQCDLWAALHTAGKWVQRSSLGEYTLNFPTRFCTNQSNTNILLMMY